MDPIERSGYDEIATFVSFVPRRKYQMRRKGKRLFLTSTLSSVDHVRSYDSAAKAHEQFKLWVQHKFYSRFSYIDFDARPGAPTILTFPMRSHGEFEPICAAGYGDDFYVSCLRINSSTEVMYHIYADGRNELLCEVPGLNCDLWHSSEGLLLDRNNMITLVHTETGCATDLTLPQICQTLNISGDLAIWYEEQNLVVRHISAHFMPLATIPVIPKKSFPQRHSQKMQLAAAVSSDKVAWCVDSDRIEVRSLTRRSHISIQKPNPACTVQMYLTNDGNRVYTLEHEGFWGVRCYDTERGDLLWESPGCEEMSFDSEGDRIAIRMLENSTIKVYDLSGHLLRDSFNVRYMTKGASMAFTQNQLAVYTDRGIAGLYRLTS